MSEQLLKLLRDNNIEVVNEILSERNSNVIVGYHLRSPSMERHSYSIFVIREYLIKNNNPYTITDGAETIKTKTDILLHLN